MIPTCSASTLLCILRAVPLWIVALLGLALFALKPYVLRDKKFQPRTNKSTTARAA